jgi:uncharacterized membrane protein YidH (DUF202 family)
MTEPAQEIEDLDPALSRERTDLAWTRTAISFAALGVAILKFRPLVGVPIMIFSVVIWSLGLLSRQQRSKHSTARRMLLVTIAVTALSLAALAITLFGHPSSGIRL